MIVWLARHGRADWPVGAALGWSDPPLDPHGVAQADALAERLAGRPLGAVHSSDLRRARATAEAVAAPHRLPVLESTELRELAFGEWEGRALADLWLERPDEARRWEADVRHSPAAFAESVPELERRVRAFAGRLMSRGRGSGEEVVVVAHRGSLAALHAVLAGRGFSWSFRNLSLAHGEELRLAC